MTSRTQRLQVARNLAITTYDKEALLAHLEAEIPTYRLCSDDQGMRRTYEATRVLRASKLTLDVLGGLAGECTDERWKAFEETVWPQWLSGHDRLPLGERWTWGAWTLVVSRLVCPSWELLTSTRVSQWVDRLPPEDPLSTAADQLRVAAQALRFGTSALRATAINMGLRLLLSKGLDELSALGEQDLLVSRPTHGIDLLDAMLCNLGVFDRSPRNGTRRRRTTERHTPAELAKVHGVPEPFQEVVGLYLSTYSRRVSDAYRTLQGKARALAHFFIYLQQEHPTVNSCAAITPAHAKGFVACAVAAARQHQRGRFKGSGDPSTTGYAWLVEVRSFFTDLCVWATEEDSPFAGLAPAAVPLNRYDLLDVGLKKARQRARGPDDFARARPPTRDPEHPSLCTEALARG